MHVVITNIFVNIANIDWLWNKNVQLMIRITK